VFLGRRDFVKASAALIAGATLPLGAMRCAAQELTEDDIEKILKSPLDRKEVFPAKKSEVYTAVPGSISRNEMTPRLSAATHNNFYEFLPGRGGPVWRYTDDFEVEPWTVEVTGLCEKPTKFDLDDLFKFAHEERVYHFRCVERWAMNVPWSGFPLHKLLAKVEPKKEVTHVRFVTANRPKQMPGMRQADYFNWPYCEGLRIDEAMHDLTLVATGVYGAPLLKQHGSPLRIVVPWKYGYKNPKSIVKIELLGSKPTTFWGVDPYEHEYGFLSNVNPNIPHPRWSQARSYWLDTQDWFKTPRFNGYEEQVAALYPDEPSKPQRPLQAGEIAR